MSFSKELLKGNIEIVLLKVIQDLGEAYGYQLLMDIEAKSEAIFKFQESTLYPLLYRLEENGLVQSERKFAPNGKLRRYYQLTPKGEKTLKEKIAEFALFSQGMGKILKSSAHA